MWQQVYLPVADSLALSAIVAALPIAVMLIMIGILQKPPWAAALAGLGTALIVAIAVYGMPTALAVKLKFGWTDRAFGGKRPFGPPRMNRHSDGISLLPPGVSPIFPA